MPIFTRQTEAAEQDSRWGDAEKKLLRRTKFSKVLEQKVNMKKVNMDVMQRWITQRITSLLGFEDDIVVGTCVNYLSEEGKLDPKKLQLQLTGFLEKSTGTFMEELWGLLVDAQNSLGGIPSAFLQDKKQEMLQAKEEQRRQEEELHRKMVEHQEEMERAKSASERSAIADGASSSSAPEPLPRVRSRDGRRASRWGKPETSSVSTPAEEGSVFSAIGTCRETETAIEAVDDVKSERDAASGEVKTQPGADGAQQSSCKNESSIDENGCTGKSRKHPRSQGESKDEDVKKERKRKSKSKHARKSDRKKSKSRHREIEERERRRSRKNEDKEAATIHNSADEDMSSDGASEEAEIKDGVDVEEALRLKALATVASKRQQTEQGEL